MDEIKKNNLFCIIDEVASIPDYILNDIDYCSDNIKIIDFISSIKNNNRFDLKENK